MPKSEATVVEMRMAEEVESMKMAPPYVAWGRQAEMDQMVIDDWMSRL